MEKEKSLHLDYIDLANILASFSVVIMHCSGTFSYFAKTRTWFLSLFLQCITHFAIPVFFMITGTTLLEYRHKYDTKTFFKKRALNTLIPFLFWSVFYIVFYAILGHTPLPNIAAIGKMILNNEVLNIFWFFYEILGVYLAMPFLSLIAKEENKKAIEWFCILFFIFRAVLPLFTNYVTPVTFYFDPAITSGCIGYLFMGYLIKHENYSKKTRGVIYAVGALALVLMAYGTWKLSSRDGEINKFFCGYYSIFCMPYSFGFMLFIKHLPYEKLFKIFPQKLMRTIASASLGVYILHMIFLILMERDPVFSQIRSVYYMLVFSPIVYILCVLITLLFKKLPVLKHLLP